MSTESSAEGPATFDVADIRQRAAGLSGAALKDFLQETGILTREYGAGTIKLRGSYEVLQRSLNTMVQRAPNASGLSIEIPGSQWARLFFPDNLLGGDAPRLDILNLRNCSLPGPLPIFRALTHLSIHIYPPPTFPAPVYLGELLDFLDNTPQMENLELDDAFKLTRMDAELVPRRPKVRLPHLNYLDAAGSGGECNFLLGSLALPEDCEVRLTATAEGPQSVSALICAVERLVQHCCGPQRLLRPFTHVDVVYRGDDDRNVLRVGFSPAFFHPPNVWWHTQCRLTLQCTPEHRPKVYRGVLFWLFRNLRGMQSIAFEQGVAHTCEHCTTDVLKITDFFYILCGRNLDSVHTVRMPFGPVAAFCTSLSQKGMMLAPSGQAIEGPMLRGLKTLVLGDGERCEWGELSDDEHDSDDEQMSNGEQRMGLQVPLERLVLKGYSKMEREFMDSLRAKVGNNVQIEETFLEHIGEERFPEVRVGEPVVSSFGIPLILDLLADVDDDETTTGPATSYLVAAQMSGDKCPVDHPGSAQSSAAGCPVDHKSATAQECPVDHSAGSAWSKHLPHSSETLRTTPHIPNAPRVLSKDREVSSIPRADGDKWVYPSEAQFFAAMARKNHNPNAPDMRVVVPIHNAVNEVAWAHILKWEAGRGGESCGGPRLVSFKGRPGDLSPKARIRTLFGYTRPFDRHDWVVDRCGTRVRYVIDFYSGRNTQADSKVSFFLDVRPALDSWDAVKMTAGSLWDKWTSNLFRPTPGSRESNP